MRKFLMIAVLLAACTRRDTPATAGPSVLDDNNAASATATHAPGTTASAPPATASAPPATASAPSAVEPPPTIQGGVRVVPVDEAAKDPSFVQFRDELRAILARRDTKALLATLDPTMKFSFGDQRGLDAFRAMWKPDAPDSKLWQKLDEVVALGGSWSTEGPKRFVAPYVYANWPEASDSFENVVAVCQAVPVREKAKATATTIARLDYQVVKIGPNDPIRKGGKDPAWREVVLPDGRSGWIESKCVRSPIDYRAAFEKKNGAWKMVFFVAGD